MPLSSIAKLVGLGCDERHDRTERLFKALERISDFGEKGGGRPLDMQAIRASANEAAAESRLLPSEEEAVAQYLGALPERTRTMLKKWHQGRSAYQIAKSMNASPQAVARSLAKIYADLRVMHRHYAPKQATSI